MSLCALFFTYIRKSSLSLSLSLVWKRRHWPEVNFLEIGRPSNERLYIYYYTILAARKREREKRARSHIDFSKSSAERYGCSARA